MIVYPTVENALGRPCLGGRQYWVINFVVCMENKCCLRSRSLSRMGGSGPFPSYLGKPCQLAIASHWGPSLNPFTVLPYGPATTCTFQAAA